MVVVKVSLGDDIRRFSLSALPSFAELRTMLEKLFSVTISGSLDVKYLDSEGDQITVTSDAELVDAFGMATTVNDSKLLRLYLVPRGTNPALMASVAPSRGPVTAEVDLTSLLTNLANSSASSSGGDSASSSNNGGNPLVNLLTNLLSASTANPQGAQGGASNGCPWMASRPEEGPRVHMYYVCDGCEVTPIRGNLYQCDVCPDFHLCEKCRAAGVHLDKNHTFSVNPPRRAHCGGGRWGGRRPGHGHAHGHGHSHNQSPAATEPTAAQSPSVTAPTTAQPISVPADTNNANPIASPAGGATKPPVPVVNVPWFGPTKPSSILETPPKPPTIVPHVQVVPSERLEMSFLSDVTMPDGSEVRAGESFNKVWRLSNSGHATWPLGCRLSLESNTGEKLSSVETIDIPGEVPPGSAVTISVEMEAPKKSGRHVSYWRMHGPTGQAFGNRIWVDIIATGEPAVAPSAPVAVVQAPAATAVKPGEQYASQLENLYRMGFLNVDLNRNLLEHNKGNVSAVIDQLCAHQN